MAYATAMSEASKKFAQMNVYVADSVLVSMCTIRAHFSYMYAYLSTCVYKSAEARTRALSLFTAYMLEVHAYVLTPDAVDYMYIDFHRRFPRSMPLPAMCKMTIAQCRDFSVQIADELAEHNVGARSKLSDFFRGLFETETHGDGDGDGEKKPVSKHSHCDDFCNIAVQPFGEMQNILTSINSFYASVHHILTGHALSIDANRRGIGLILGMLQLTRQELLFLAMRVGVVTSIDIGAELIGAYLDGRIGVPRMNVVYSRDEIVASYLRELYKTLKSRLPDKCKHLLEKKYGLRSVLVYIMAQLKIADTSTAALVRRLEGD